MSAKIEIHNDKDDKAIIIITQSDGEKNHPCAKITVESNGHISVKLDKDQSLQIIKDE